MAEVAEHMVFSTRRTAYAVHKRLGNGELLRVSRGVFIELSFLLMLSDYAAIRAIELARIKAVSKSRRTAIICGVAAALVHGADPHGVVTTIDVNCRENARGTAIKLPRLYIPFQQPVVVDEGMIRFHCRTIPDRWIHSTVGVSVLNGKATLVWIALCDRTSQAFSSACTLLKTLARFDTRPLWIEGSRERERRTIEDVCRGIGFLRPGPSNRKALTFARALSGAVAPGGECRFLWILFRHGLLEGLVPQLVITWDGNSYRADFAWPAFHLIIEFDGWAKYPGDDKEALRAFLSDQERRARALNAASWTVIRFSSDDLGEPDRIEREIRQSMKAAEERWGLAS